MVMQVSLTPPTALYVEISYSDYHHGLDVGLFSIRSASSASLHFLAVLPTERYMLTTPHHQAELPRSQLRSGFISGPQLYHFPGCSFGSNVDLPHDQVIESEKYSGIKRCGNRTTFVYCHLL